MAKRFVKEALLRVGIPTDKVVVIGSGVLDTLGIRASNDVDIILPEDEFEKLSNNPRFTKAVKFGDTYYQEIKGPIEAWSYWWDMKDDKKIEIDTLLKNSITIDGIRYITLDFLRNWKMCCAREKDLADVLLIDAYLKEHHG